MAVEMFHLFYYCLLFIINIIATLGMHEKMCGILFIRINKEHVILRCLIVINTQRKLRRL